MKNFFTYILFLVAVLFLLVVIVFYFNSVKQREDKSYQLLFPDKIIKELEDIKWSDYPILEGKG